MTNRNMIKPWSDLGQLRSWLDKAGVKFEQRQRSNENISIIVPIVPVGSGCIYYIFDDCGTFQKFEVI